MHTRDGNIICTVNTKYSIIMLQRVHLASCLLPMYWLAEGSFW